MSSDRVLSAEDTVRTLRSYAPMSLPTGRARRSAVLVPLRRLQGDSALLEIVFTRRAATLSAHSGQVAFPGGVVDASDPGPIDAALREAHEELGLPVADVEVIGLLDEMLTVTGYHVVPVVGLIPTDTPLVAAEQEVARIFSVPLAKVLDDNAWERREHHWRGSCIETWHVLHDGEDIWGATAIMLRGMVELLWQTSATGVATPPR